MIQVIKGPLLGFISVYKDDKYICKYEFLILSDNSVFEHLVRDVDFRC